MPSRSAASFGRSALLAVRGALKRHLRRAPSGQQLASRVGRRYEPREWAPMIGMTIHAASAAAGWGGRRQSQCRPRCGFQDGAGRIPARSHDS